MALLFFYKIQIFFLAQTEISFMQKLRCFIYSAFLVIRVFAATWNVAGKTPDRGLNLNDFLPSDDYSDIYVLGYAQIQASQSCIIAIVLSAD